MTTVRFEVDIVGPKPDEVPATDLCEFITEFVNAVAGAGGDAGPPDAERAQATPAVPCVSLVEISEGSDRLTFATTREYARAIARIASSIRRGRYTSLPRTVHESLHRMSQVTHRRGWGIRFPANRKLGIVTATVKKGTDIPAPKALPAMTGSTTILARLMRVGGVSPRAELRLPNRPDLLYVDVTEDMAMVLAGRLYQDVSLEGTATWDSETWRLRSFKVVRLLDFAAVSPAAAFRELAAAVGDAWNGVDALEFVRSTREGGDGDLH